MHRRSQDLYAGVHRAPKAPRGWDLGRATLKQLHFVAHRRCQVFMFFLGGGAV
jgi:hypothetical protein